MTRQRYTQVLAERVQEQERMRQVEQQLRDAPCDPATSILPCYNQPAIDYGKVGRNAGDGSGGY